MENFSNNIFLFYTVFRTFRKPKIQKKIEQHSHCFIKIVLSFANPGVLIIINLKQQLISNKTI